MDWPAREARKSARKKRAREFSRTNRPAGPRARPLDLLTGRRGSLLTAHVRSD